MVQDVDKMLAFCTPPKSCGSKQSTESNEADSWAIPAAMQIVDSDQDSVDVLRFDEPEGRASWIAGEPPPSVVRARNTAAVLTAFGAVSVPKSCAVSGQPPTRTCNTLSAAILAQRQTEDVRIQRERARIRTCCWQQVRGGH